MKCSGTADLPLHGVRAPPWLANRVRELGTAVAEQMPRMPSDPADEAIALVPVDQTIARVNAIDWQQVGKSLGEQGICLLRAG
jgi:hypothetical protein